MPARTKLSRLARARDSILRLLAEVGRPLTSGELGQHAQAGRTTADERLEILRGLERDGLIEQTAVPNRYRPPAVTGYRLAVSAPTPTPIGESSHDRR